MQFIELPPQEAPRQLTARVPTRTLQEHLMGFLNANNAHGYIEEFTPKEIKVRDYGPISALILATASHKQLTIRCLKESAKRIKRASQGTLQYCRACDIVARSFGYKSGHEMFALGKANGGMVLRIRDISDLDKELLGAFAKSTQAPDVAPETVPL